ncbi:MAG: hypothetical protein ACLRX7_01780 [Acutalibacteraceae bacterium]
MEYLRSYKFEDLTFRGTIEYRSACCQPVSECMCVAAFHVGLQENWMNWKHCCIKTEVSINKDTLLPN